jgi:hypothetical protein
MCRHLVERIRREFEHRGDRRSRERIAHRFVVEFHHRRVGDLAGRGVFDQHTVFDLRLGGQLRPTAVALLMERDIANRQFQFGDGDDSEADQGVAAKGPKVVAANGQFMWYGHGVMFLNAPA